MKQFFKTKRFKYFTLVYPLTGIGCDFYPMNPKRKNFGRPVKKKSSGAK